jgi:hypothetical protein
MENFFIRQACKNSWMLPVVTEILDLKYGWYSVQVSHCNKTSDAIDALTLKKFHLCVYRKCSKHVQILKHNILQSIQTNIFTSLRHALLLQIIYNICYQLGMQTIDSVHCKIYNISFIIIKHTGFWPSNVLLWC